MEDESEFLKDQGMLMVQRLNAALAEYQMKYPPLGQAKESPLSEEGPAAPWLTDKSMLSPLLIEYDATITSLKDDLGKQRGEVHELRSQVDKLVAENQRLTRELKENVQSQLDGYAGSESDITFAGEDQVLHNLQRQLQNALQEKDSAMEMWQASNQEVERLEEQLREQQYSPRLQALEVQASQVKGQYSKTVSDMTAEMDKLREELRHSRNEEKAAKIQVTDLRSTLEQLRNELVHKEQERSVLAGRDESKESKLERLKDQLQEMESRLSATKNELTEAVREKNQLEKDLTKAQSRSTEHEQKEYESVMQVRDSVQMVENAVMERDQALMREKQKDEEVTRLQTAISEILDEAGARTRKEVDAVKIQCNENLTKLMEEIHALEMDNSEKQAQLERILREKRAVESELEKIYQEGMTKGSQESSSYDDLNRRACQAERLRDEALMKADSLNNTLRRSEAEHKKDKQHLETEIQSLKDSITQLTEEFEMATEERVKLAEQLDEMKRSSHQLKQERDAANRKLNKETACMEREQQLKDREFEVKIQTQEDSHRHAQSELRQLLASQQRMSAKWKEECQSISLKFERKVNDLRSEVSQQKKRNNELNNLLRESRDKTGETEQMLMEYSRNIKRLEGRVRDAENRAAAVTQQATRQLARSQLQRHLEMNIYDSNKQSLRSSQTAEELMLSDLAINQDKQQEVSRTLNTNGETIH